MPRSPALISIAARARQDGGEPFGLCVIVDATQSAASQFGVLDRDAGQHALAARHQIDQGLVQLHGGGVHRCGDADRLARAAGDRRIGSVESPY